MATPYVGEIRMFAGNFPPQGWTFCRGQLLSIADNEVLFTLLGITYGGDGVTTFGVPDLQGRVPIHQGQGLGLTNRVIGEKNGTSVVPLTIANLPNHNHTVNGSLSLMTRGDAAGNFSSPVDHSIATAPLKKFFNKTLVAGQTMSPLDATATIVPAGGSQPHDNMQPYLAISFIISLFGIFPSQN